ncbi:alpha/beta hydrolase [Streptomyces sp. NPDC101160]|uniref:alpha/beta hydrolase n=1 Tax=Streptomyces sp. NPDC101160 TaxID=3366118 RepID=UPI00380E191F
MTSSRAKLTLAERIQRAMGVLACRLPQPVLRRLADVPVNTDGEEMAPEIALLMRMTEAGDDYSDLAPAGAREVVEAESRIFADRMPSFAIQEELRLPGGLQATRYRAGSSSRGLVLFFHGGGFVLGSRASYDSPVKLLALKAGVDVLSVEYRLAPEHPFPAPHEDALTAWGYAVEHAAQWGLDPHRIVVAGESSGGNVAAVLCQQLRGREVQPFLQVLIYPVVDLSTERPSHHEFAGSPALSAKQIKWFSGHYLPAGTDVKDPRVSPLLGNLDGLPPAVVSVAGFDPLRDEALEYAAELLENGVPTRVLREGGLVHGFISFTALSRTSRAATERIAEEIARAMSPDGVARASGAYRF